MPMLTEALLCLLIYFNPSSYQLLIETPFQVFVLAFAAAAPLEDTPEVAAAKAEFQAAFDAAVAGEHAALAPVNNDIQAEQIAAAYLDDIEEVAAAKASFKAAFDDAVAGGLAAKQEAAPVHVIAAPEPLADAPVDHVVHALLLGYPRISLDAGAG